MLSHTRDGYAVTMPRFRVRRVQRRLRTRNHDPHVRAAAGRLDRLIDFLVGRSRRRSSQATRFPVFDASLGGRRIVLHTRVVAPRRVELLYVRVRPRP